MLVSKRLGLKAIPKDATKTVRRRAYVERIEVLKRLLKKGQMSPKLTQRCEEYIRSAEYRIRQIDKAPKSDPTKIKVSKSVDLTHTVDPRLLKAAAAVDKEIRDHGTIDGVAVPPRRRMPKIADKPVNSAQGFLPNFLSQLDTARIEELVADKIFQRLAIAVDQSVENLFKKAGSDE